MEEQFNLNLEAPVSNEIDPKYLAIVEEIEKKKEDRPRDGVEIQMEVVLRHFPDRSSHEFKNAMDITSDILLKRNYDKLGETLIRERDKRHQGNWRDRQANDRDQW